MSPSAILDRVRRPEYTGQNRCLPCTAFNLVLAVLVSGGIAVWGSTRVGPEIASLGGVVLFVLFAGSIYLRGYLVPGTPWITKTYFPDWLLRVFGKEPTPIGNSSTDEVDVEAILLRAGAVAQCEHEEDLCLTDEFHTAWRERIVGLREGDTGRQELAAVLDVEPDRLTFEEHGDAFVASLDDKRAGQWESHAAFMADVAAARQLRTQADFWSDIPVQARSVVLNGLRIFLEQCPSCDGPVSLREDVVESCCRSINVIAVTCQDCGARVFEVEQPG
jgi:hypothetical protein